MKNVPNKMNRKERRADKKEVLREYMLRMRVSYHAYIYEIEADPEMTDFEWDRLAATVDVNKTCGDIELDKWYKEKYDCSTGMWIHTHPQRPLFEMKYKNEHG